MLFKKFLAKNKLQTFSDLALMGSSSIVIGLDKNLMIRLFNLAAEKYFDLNATICLGHYYTLLSKYIELDSLTYLLQQKSEYPLLTKNILTKAVHSSRLSKDLVWSLQKIFDRRKSCLGFLLTSEESEDTAVEEEKRFSNFSPIDLINKIPGSVYFKDLEGKYLWCNDFVVKMAGGKSVSDIIGKDDYELCWKEVASQYVENDKKVIKNGKPEIVEEPMKFADGTINPCLTYKSPLCDKAGNIIGIVGNSLDISDQKKLLDKIKKEFSKQEEVLYYLTKFANSLPGSLYFKDINGKYLWVNDYVVKMAGMKSVLDIVGKDDYQLCWSHISDQYRENDLEVIKNKQLKLCEETIFLADGRTIHLLTNKTPVFDDNGEVIGVMGNSLDITEHKKLEDTLKKAREDAEAANRAKIQFIADMSHDVKTPLLSIILLSQSLTDEMEKKHRNLTEETMICAKNLWIFFENCIELSKLGNNSFVSPQVNFNLEKLVNEVVQLFLPATRTRQLKIHIDYSAEIPPQLLGDRINLYRILLNLMSNAIKFTWRGSITIRVLPIHQKSTSDEIFIALSVIDTGDGISKDKQDVIFERFSQFNSSDSIYESRGIGLDVVQRLVHLMKGKVEVESEEGKGSRFTVVVPLKVVNMVEELV